MKYYLLPYTASTKYPNIWDSIGNEKYSYPNVYLGDSDSKNGACTHRFTGVGYVICKDSSPTQEMTDIIVAETAAWNLANPSNQTGDMQMIFEEGEKGKIATQLAAREAELVAAGVL